MAGILKGIRAAFGDVEMTPYKVLVEREGYEERLYPARNWACTKMEGSSQEELTSPMFRTLFNYISGKNVPNIRVDMTSPVTTHIQKGTITMGFLVPVDHQHDPPDPGTDNIFIEHRPEMIVLVRRFGGYINDEILAREKGALENAIRKGGEVGVNFAHYYIAGYDPPFKPIGRRNEIWFVKRVNENGNSLENGNSETGYGNSTMENGDMGNGNVMGNGNGEQI